MIAFTLALSGFARPPADGIVPRDRFIRGRVELDREWLVEALGEVAASACPAGVACVFSPTPGITLFVEADGRVSQVWDRERLWAPADRSHWMLQDGARTEVPLSLPGVGPLQPAWDAVPDVGSEPPVLLAQLDASPSTQLIVSDETGGPTLLDSRGWPPLARTGLQPGDRVRSVDGTSVETAAEVKRALASARGTTARVVAERAGVSVEGKVAVLTSRLHCWKAWGGSDAVLERGESPPTDAVRIACPSGVASLLGVTAERP
jgi:hypothetical protein